MNFRFSAGLTALIGACLLASCATKSPEQKIAVDVTSPQLKKQVGVTALATPIAIIATVSPHYRLSQLAENVPIPNFIDRALNQPSHKENGSNLANETYGKGANDKSIFLKRSTPEVDALIKKYANAYEVPESLVRRVVDRESRGNPNARNGPYWGLMQISHPTAKKMGYRGYPAGLLDAETNLRYAVKYLAGAYLVANRDQDKAVRYYARGYHYDASSQNLLEKIFTKGRVPSGVNTKQAIGGNNAASTTLKNTAPNEPLSLDTAP